MSDNKGGDDKALMDKMLWRILPLTVLASVVAVIDRGNIGFAKLGMLNDISLTEASFGLGASLFFLGYTAFEIPSTMASHHVGARVWFARIMLTWGIITILLAFTQSQTMFYILRFVLGAAEAGLYPAQLYYLTLWFPQRERVRAMGVLTLGSAFGNGLTALICGGLLEADGLYGLAGWQWIFLVTGMFPIVTTILVLRYLPNRPSEAKFLNAAEKSRIEMLLQSDASRTDQRGHALSVLRNPKIGLFGVAYALILGSLGGVVYWAPSVLNAFGLTGYQNGLLIALPWAIDAVVLVVIPPRLKSERAILAGLATFSILAIVSFAAAAMTADLWLSALALMVGIPAISLAIVCFWTLPVRHFANAHAAAAIASISTIGNLGNFTAQNAMPALATLGRSTSAGL